MKNIWKISCAVTIVAAIAIAILFFQQRNDFVKARKNFTTASYQSDTLEAYKSFFDLNMKYPGITLEDMECHHKDSTVFLSELVRSKPVLVLRFSDVNCAACVENLLHQLDNNHSNNVLILCSYQEKKDFEILIHSIVIKYPIYLTDGKYFQWETELSALPYFFVLRQNLSVSSVFIPDNRFGDITKQYFDATKIVSPNDENK
ncbi:MAG: hypothetical protein LBE91_00320 [Tannerella sp.]|jgi:hypothetical protein|nr:hypothetical protein [Tannerella sp.]